MPRSPFLPLPLFLYPLLSLPFSRSLSPVKVCPSCFSPYVVKLFSNRWNWFSEIWVLVSNEMFTGPVIGHLRSPLVRQVLSLFSIFFFSIATATLKTFAEWKTRGPFFLMLNYSKPVASFCFLRPVGELVAINFSIALMFRLTIT